MDDATGQVPAVTFRDEEDAHGYFRVLHTLTQTKGIPVASYSDRRGIFHRSKTKRPLTLQEQLAGEPASTQVARALRELGIQWIPASSPQATDETDESVKPLLPQEGGGVYDAGGRG